MSDRVAMVAINQQQISFSTARKMNLFSMRYAKKKEQSLGKLQRKLRTTPIQLLLIFVFAKMRSAWFFTVAGFCDRLQR